LILPAVSLQRILRPTGSTPAEEEESEDNPTQDIAVFPLATPPLIAGPGSIVTVVLLTNNEQLGFVEQAQTMLVMFAVLAILYGLLLIAGGVQRFLGRTGADVLSRIAALVLAALSIGILLDGIRASFSAI
jgi:multiple antibiotic resistance protein